MTVNYTHVAAAAGADSLGAPFLRDSGVVGEQLVAGLRDVAALGQSQLLRINAGSRIISGCRKWHKEKEARCHL